MLLSLASAAVAAVDPGSELEAAKTPWAGIGGGGAINHGASWYVGITGGGPGASGGATATGNAPGDGPPLVLPFC